MNHTITFTMHGKTHRVLASREIPFQEFLGMLYYTRRLIGYVIYPRWCAVRLLLGDTIDMMRRNGLWRHEMKRVTGMLTDTFNKFEEWHKRDFDLEFISLIGDGLAYSSMKVVNELRGAIGAEMMKKGVKRYIILSYPYAVLDMAYDNTVTYHKALEAVRMKYGVDFSKVFAKYKGEMLYQSCQRMMNAFVDAIGEEIPRISWDNTLAQKKMTQWENFIINEDNIHKAFRDAYEELPEEKRPALEAAMSIWDSEESSLEEEEEDDVDVIDILSGKYNVKPIKKNAKKKETVAEETQGHNRR